MEDTDYGYCSECGRKLVDRGLTDAGNIDSYVNFDTKTGKKIMVRWVACPKKKIGWPSLHNYFVKEKVLI